MPNSIQDNTALRALPFGEYLCAQELISEEQLLEARGDYWSNGGNIGAAICRQGFLGRDELELQAAIYHSLDAIS